MVGCLEDPMLELDILSITRWIDKNKFTLQLNKWKKIYIYIILICMLGTCWYFYEKLHVDMFVTSCCVLISQLHTLQKMNASHTLSQEECLIFTHEWVIWNWTFLSRQASRNQNVFATISICGRPTISLSSFTTWNKLKTISRWNISKLA